MSAGEKVYFDYQATSPPSIKDGDWFEAAIGLYDDSSNLKGCKVYRGNTMSSYTSDHFNIPSTGNYKLGFFAGSYD
eukprot:scaffold141047_cov121-Phaeocystis_antarctica.AAC.1